MIRQLCCSCHLPFESTEPRTICPECERIAAGDDEVCGSGSVAYGNYYDSRDIPWQDRD